MVVQAAAAGYGAGAGGATGYDAAAYGANSGYDTSQTGYGQQASAYSQPAYSTAQVSSNPMTLRFPCHHSVGVQGTHCQHVVPWMLMLPLKPPVGSSSPGRACLQGKQNFLLGLVAAMQQVCPVSLLYTRLPESSTCGGGMVCSLTAAILNAQLDSFRKSPIVTA